MKKKPERRTMGAYPKSREKAGEIFRLTVAFLAKHELIINPVNFSIAYHYLITYQAQLLSLGCLHNGTY
ncbi:MAG: hypothetical protein JAZ02_15525 [Candidatus Thiodiazotropha endolucinida]|nr:hypothetical protein [Candidatus Thiodiazotropha endolucinida]